MATKILALGCATSLMLLATSATAQIRPAPARGAAPARVAAPAGAPISQGPAIPGLCILSVNQAISTSTVGQYVRTRLDQIVAQVKAELSPEDTTINNDVRTLESSRATLDAATYQTRGAALSTRINTLRQKADLRQREVKATEDKALNRIAQELEPIAQQLYQQKRCSALLDKGSVMIANNDMDLTSAAVVALDAKIQQFAIERERINPAAAAR